MSLYIENPPLAMIPLFVWIALVIAGLLLAGAKAVGIIAGPIAEPINKFIESLNGPVGYGIAVSLTVLAVFSGLRSRSKKPEEE